MDGKFIFIGSEYKVQMCNTVSEVDEARRRNLFGQVDTWLTEMRIYKHRPYRDLRKTWLHEVIHLIELHLDSDNFRPTDHEIDQIADVLYDTLDRNNMLADSWEHIMPGEKDNE